MNDIEFFKALIKDLYEAKLLMFDKHLALFLMRLSKNQRLMQLLKECNRDFYFEEEAEHLFFEGKFPKNKKHFFALIVGLLAKADVGEITSSQLFTAIFPDAASPSDAFDLFRERILVPLESVVCALLQGEPVEEEPEKNMIYDKMNEDIFGWLDLLKEKLKYNPLLDDKKLAEVFAMCDGFRYSLESSSLHIQKLVFLGLKNTLLKYRLFCKEIAEIDALFVLYGVDMELFS